MAEEVRATEAARRKAEELGIELSEIESSSEDGTIREEDVLSAVLSGQASKPSSAKNIWLSMEGGEGVTFFAPQGQTINPKKLTTFRGGQKPQSISEEEKTEQISEEQPTSSRRLNVVFSEEAYRELKKLADQQGKTISAVVRDAIALQKWFTDTQKAGGRILVEERGRVREILNIR